MSWHECLTCEGSRTIVSDEKNSESLKSINYHEATTCRSFRITINTLCQENRENCEYEELQSENSEGSASSCKTVHFFVNLSELVVACPYFGKFDGLEFLEFSTNCTDTWISAPASLMSTRDECQHRYTSAISARSFHAFLDSVCPSQYGIRPAPVTINSIVPVLDILSHFNSEPLLTNCERFLMSINIGQLDGSLLIRLLDKGLCVSLDHRVLGRILCVCLMNIASKMSDVSQDLNGIVGSVFAQAFVANSTKSFRHIKPLEQESALWPVAIRHLMIPAVSSSSGTGTSSEETTNTEENKRRKNKKRNHRQSECDHAEDSFECILCFDQRCGKCKGEAAFCYKALDNFLYEVRLQLYPHTYRPHLDRDLLREDRFSDYILGQPFQPLPDE
uniref:Uncharacterized protein n=1 Tax=Caenorhabditis tropicalis TaxID=1561998 RepID=A0A1I7UUQ1_9PELO